MGRGVVVRVGWGRSSHPMSKDLDRAKRQRRNPLSTGLSAGTPALLMLYHCPWSGSQDRIGCHRVHSSVCALWSVGAPPSAPAFTLPVLTQQGEQPQGSVHGVDANQGVGSAISAFSIPREAASAR